MTLSDRESTLLWARQLVDENNWVTFDTETTGFKGEIVEWALCNSMAEVLSHGFIKPAVPIEPDAFKVHRISNEMVKNAPIFPTVWPEIWSFMRNKIVVIYNAKFDIEALHRSAFRRGLKIPLSAINHRCAMTQYAKVYGERKQWGNKDYKWQSLSDAMIQLGLKWDGSAHGAIADAKATVAIVRKMANIHLVTTLDYTPVPDVNTWPEFNRYPQDEE